MKPEPHLLFAGHASWDAYQVSLKLPALDEHMDADVRERLELVRKLAHYGFFEYEFIDVALDRGLATLELMLRKALGSKPKGLRGLVARAKAVGWGDIARRAEVLVGIRNGYAHPDRNLQWSVAGLTPLQIVFDVANDLATLQRTERTNNAAHAAGESSAVGQKWSRPVSEPFDLSTLDGTIEVAKAAARRYRELTGKPLGITGEIGEVVAARLLGLKLADARQAGYDAVGSDGRRVQIKSRCILPDSKPGQRLGSIRLDHEWDTVALILMDQDFEPVAVYEANRKAVERELRRPGSKARNERGSLGVSKFKAIAQLRWPRGDRAPTEPVDPSSRR